MSPAIMKKALGRADPPRRIDGTATVRRGRPAAAAAC